MLWRDKTNGCMHVPNSTDVGLWILTPQFKEHNYIVSALNLEVRAEIQFLLPEMEEGVTLILYADITDVKWLTPGVEKLKRQCVVKQPERKPTTMKL